MIDPKGKILGTGYDLVPTKVNLNPSISGNDNYLSFFQDKLLIQRSNILLYYKCSIGNFDVYNCNIDKTVTLDQTLAWDNHNRFMAYQDFSFTWICNKTDCFAAFYDYKTKTSGMFLLTEEKSLLTDAMIINDNSNGIKLAAALTNEVVFWVGTIKSFTFSKWLKIDTTNVPTPEWCPRTIDISPDDRFTFYVYNDCRGLSKKVLSWNLQLNRLEFIQSVSGFYSFEGSSSCPMGNEFIYFPKKYDWYKVYIYSTSTQNDIEYASIPASFFDSQYRYDCLASIKRSVVYGDSKVMVIYGNRMREQVRRYPVLKTDFKLKGTRGFVGIQSDSILHMGLDASNNLTWYQSFDGPVVKMTTESAPGTYSAEFDFYSTQGSHFSIELPIKVVAS